MEDNVNDRRPEEFPLLRRAIQRLEEDSAALLEAKERYGLLKGFLRGRMDHIIKVAIEPLVDSSLLHSELMCMRPHMDTESMKRLFYRICELLDIHYIHAFSVLSYAPDNEDEEAITRLRFSRRSLSTCIGGLDAYSTFIKELEEDKKNIGSFLKNHYKATFSGIGDEQISASLDVEGYKTPEMIKVLINTARLANVPPNTEVVIYYAGHGQKDTGNWIVRDTDGFCVDMPLETILNEWIKCDQAKNLHLTIIADCCYSGCWVKEFENNAIFQTHRAYPICIQAACSENEEARGGEFVKAYRNSTWTCRCLQVQHPMYYSTPNHRSVLPKVPLTSKPHRSVLPKVPLTSKQIAVIVVCIIIPIIASVGWKIIYSV